MTKKSILTSFLAATAFSAASFASGASNTHGTTGSFLDKAPGHSLNANSSLISDTQESSSYQCSLFIDLLDDTQKQAIITQYTSETDIQPEDFNIPILESKSNSLNVIYLDFNGEFIRDTAWNEEAELGNTTEWNALSYSLDENRLTFNDAEKNAIEEIWRRVAEDFAPFDVNVTTRAPGNFTNTTAHVVITPHYDVHGVRLPHFEKGGVSYQDSFGTDDYAQRRNISFVQADYSPSQIAEAISHEIGHNLGLSHDGIFVDGELQEYYSGEGDWAPIMGNSYNKNITQWSNGNYDNASNDEDDIQIIASKLPLIADDHGNSKFSATQLIADEFLNASASGLINSIDDIDTFIIAGELGDIQLNISTYTATRDTLGLNLLLNVRLQDRNGNTLYNNTVAGSSVLNYTLPETDAYYLSISPSNIVNAPSNYGSLGEYTITGTLTPNNPRAPEASSDSYSLVQAQNYFTTINSGVLANDFDVNGDTLYAVKLTDPNHGKLSFNEDGSFAYFPYIPKRSDQEAFIGTDSFTYYATDGKRNSEIITVTLNIRGEVFPNEDGTLPHGWSTSARETFGDTLSSESHWFADTFNSEGNYSFRAGPITHSQETSLFYQGFTDAGTFSFRYRVSSEEGWDFLTVIINNSTVLEASGISNWTTFSTELDAGYHEIEFKYSKDGSADEYIDTTWIDNVIFPSDFTPEDQAPQVDAGPDLDVEISDGAAVLGSAIDEGLPNGNTTISWRQISGPSTATLSSTTTPRTNISFTDEGVYVFELSASDTAQTSSDQVTITVGPDVVDFYTVTFVLGDQGTPTAGNEDLVIQEVAENTAATEPIFTVDSEYVFSGWSYPFDNVESNLLITARYILKEDFNPIPVYRLYNPNSGLHHFTSNQAENDYLVSLGWNAEGTPYRLLDIKEGDADVVIDGVEAKPFYRLYNWGNGEHFFTMNQAEAEYLRDIVAWYFEGNIGYGFQERVTFTTPLYRLYNPVSGFHHYTTSVQEQFLLTSLEPSWIDEGIVAWVYPDEDLFPDTVD